MYIKITRKISYRKKYDKTIFMSVRFDKRVNCINNRKRNVKRHSDNRSIHKSKAYTGIVNGLLINTRNCTTTCIFFKFFRTVNRKHSNNHFCKATGFGSYLVKHENCSSTAALRDASFIYRLVTSAIRHYKL